MDANDVWKLALYLAFNQGCDARLRGEAETCNPYNALDADERPFAVNWSHGWDHVRRAWGRDVAGRWQFMPLPLVVESGTAYAV